MIYTTLSLFGTGTFDVILNFYHCRLQPILKIYKASDNSRKSDPKNLYDNNIIAFKLVIVIGQ